MTADQIAKISATVREVFESPSRDTCATFAVVGNPDAWAQVMKGVINLAYPRDEAPDGTLLQLLTWLPGAAIGSWESETFVTIEFESINPLDVAKAVDALLDELFDVGDDYSVKCTVKKL
jgi:hypothetical protein